MQKEITSVSQYLDIIRRLDPIEVIREPCVMCQVGYGYDFVIAPRAVAKNATTARRRDSYVVDRAV